MKRLLILVVCMFLLCGCASAQQESIFPFTFTDDAGRTVTLDSAPQNAAILFGSLADVWVTAGGQDMLGVTVGESIERGFAPEGTCLVDEGSGHNEINLELLFAAQPDFVVGTLDYEGQVNACEAAARQGIPSALFRIETFEDYLRVLEIFTGLCGTPERYGQYGLQVQRDIQSLFAGASLPETAPTMLFVRAGTSARSTKAKVGADQFACAMLEEMGLVNIAYEAEILLDGLSLESVVLSDPEYLFFTAMGDEQAVWSYVEEMLTQPGWRDLSTVKEGKVHLLPKSLFHYKPNARWAQAYQYLFELFSKEQLP